MAEGVSHAVRDNRKSRLLGTFAGWLMRAWCSTLRYEIEDRSGVGRAEGQSGPVVYALWHNRLFMVPYAWRRLVKHTRQVVVLTSASHDGSALAHAMKVFDIGAVRGSSSRRAVAALVGMRRALQEGLDVCVTPDGPRGPRYRIQPGVVKLAQSVGVPLIPVHVEALSCWELKTWDRFQIPVPFSKVRVIFDEALAIASELSEDEFREACERFESLLKAGVREDFSETNP